MTTLTPAQARALEWLPSSGEWRTNPARVWGALNSLQYCHTGHFVEAERGNFGARGTLMWQYRLTPAGIAFKAEWEKLR